MRRGTKLLIYYFVFFGVLSVIALIPGGALFVFLLTAMGLPLLGIPGLLVIASPTILFYSAALIPLWLASSAPRGRIWLVAAAALIPAAVAIEPGAFSRSEATQFATRMSENDMSGPAADKPRSIELVGDSMSGMYVVAQRIGDEHASCNEICRRLLFNGEVDWVRMTRLPDNRRAAQTWHATYHLEHRVSCPQVYPDGAAIEKAFRDRLVAGDCLIGETGGSDAPDAVVTFTTRYFDQSYPPRPPDGGPKLGVIESVKELRIESRQGGALSPALQQTETVARTIALPLYFGTEMHLQGGYNGPTIGREKTVMKPIDLAAAMRNTFGYQIGEISGPPAEDPRKVAEGVLALPPDANPAFSSAQQDVLNDALGAIAKQSALSEADVDFVRRVIADHRVTEPKLGVLFQNMFHKHSSALQPLIPVVLDRISTPVPERIGHYHSLLGWSVANYSADSLRPYRDMMIAVVRAQPDWPSGGVLTRLAELGSDDANNLVIERLGSKSARQFAAIAACRASPEAWTALEAPVLAYLMQPKKRNQHEEEAPLLLALVRFGKKSQAVDIIEKNDFPNKQRMLDRLAKFGPGFGPEHCRDWL